MLNLQALRQVIRLSERIENNTRIRKDLMKYTPASRQLDLMVKVGSNIAMNEDNYVSFHISAAIFSDALSQAIGEDQSEIKQIEKEIREESK